MKNNREASGIEKRRHTTFVLIRPTGELLLQLRDGGKGRSIQFPFMWCFPGGSSEADETPIDTIVREAMEEYEIALNKNKCVFLVKYSLPPSLEDDYVYTCRVSDSVNPRLKEGAGFAWLTFEAVSHLELAWHQEKILPKLKKFLENKI